MKKIKLKEIVIAGKRYYTITGLAEKFQLNPTTITRYINRGQIKAIKNFKKWFIPEEEIEKMFQKKAGGKK